MLILNSPEELIQFRHSLDKEIAVGFVPTMGALHEGHASLIRKSSAENQMTVCSIFVNALQFNNPEDLKHYPKTPEQDENIASDAGCNLLFRPMPGKWSTPLSGFNPQQFGELDLVLEGKFRPGHFAGMAFIVSTLFSLVKPQKAYFGEKDFQQLAIVKKLATAQFPEISIIACPTLRSPAGLALSSRNAKIPAEDLPKANLLNKFLLEGIQYKMQLPPKEICSFIRRKLEAAGWLPDYVEIVDANTFKPVSAWQESNERRLLAAAFLGKIRLIDNMEI